MPREEKNETVLPILRSHDLRGCKLLLCEKAALFRGVLKSTNRCTHFVFNPMDALGFVTEYAPRKERD